MEIKRKLPLLQEFTSFDFKCSFSVLQANYIANSADIAATNCVYLCVCAVLCTQHTKSTNTNTNRSEESRVTVEILLLIQTTRLQLQLWCSTKEIERRSASFDPANDLIIMIMAITVVNTDSD